MQQDLLLAGILYCLSSQLYYHYLYRNHIKKRTEKRSVNTTSLVSTDQNKLNDTIDELEVIDAEFEGLIASWRDLVPSVVGCYASLSGCDFCFYFLAVYNLSVTPAVCNGGCALGVIGSCSAMVTQSIQNTIT